jgi:hypothetical protein
VIDNTWWKVHKSTINDLRSHKRTFIQKFIHIKLPSNYRQNKFYKYLDPVCTKCLEESETQEHIWKCKNVQKEQV